MASQLEGGGGSSDTGASLSGTYKARVAAFAAVGYVVYLLMLILALAIVAGSAALLILKPSLVVIKLGWKLGIPMLVLVWGLLRALKVTTVEPTGIPLTPSMAPKLFAIIDELSQTLKVPPLEKVLATEDYNAAVVQRPRLGFFGSRNTLIIGFPLMQSLSVEDLKAVLAHEFGHLSGNHGRFTGWIYRAVRSYVALLETTGSNALLDRFLNWYVPRLDSMTFPLRRQNEYEADAASAEIVGADRAGQALTNVHVRGAVEPGFWSAVKSQVLTTAHPPANLFLDWEKRVDSLQPADAEQALVFALQEVTGDTDTHPSLSDRLRSLGVEPRIEPVPEHSAARELLGEQYGYVAQHTGYRWAASVNDAWKAKHEQVLQGRKRVTELEVLARQRALDAEESYELADLNEDLNPERDALPAFQAVLAINPAHLGAQFSVGRILLARDDAAGVAVMQPLETSRDPSLRFAASSILAGYFSRAGDQLASEACAERAAAAYRERMASRE